MSENEKVTDEELWIVVWWDPQGAMFSLTDDEGKIIARPFEEVEGMVDEKLEDPDEHEKVRRYAVPAQLARDSFGWEI